MFRQTGARVPKKPALKQAKQALKHQNHENDQSWHSSAKIGI